MTNSTELSKHSKVRRNGRPPKNLVFTQVATVTPGANGAKRGMTAAARKAQSRRMKAYWAAKKKASK